MIDSLRWMSEIAVWEVYHFPFVKNSLQRPCSAKRQFNTTQYLVEVADVPLSDYLVFVLWCSCPED